VFAWCTNYQPSDMALIQKENAMRKIQHIADNVVILVDTFTGDGECVEKQKLVCLYPARLTWTSTHVAGPNKYSQFLYEITPLNAGQSQLKFTAASLDCQIEDKETAQKRSIELRKIDAETWKLLAHEMEKELRCRC
jgi:hypothetical protein